MKTEKIKLDAKRAIQGNFGATQYGGNELKHKPSAYGLAFKYILHSRGVSYRDASRHTLMSAQNLNYTLNRMSKERFDYALVDKLCTRLRLNRDYVDALSEEIERQLAEKGE